MPLTSKVSANVFLHVSRSLTAAAPATARTTTGFAEANGRGDGANSHQALPGQHEHHAGETGFLEDTQDNAAAVTLVFFITGNPGLIAYYHPFLSLVVERLRKREEVDRTSGPVVVAGLSLGGFETAATTGTGGSAKKGEGGGEDEDEEEELLLPRTNVQLDNNGNGAARDRIYTLGEQIELSYARVEALSSRLRFAQSGGGPATGGAGGAAGAGRRGAPPVKVVLMGHSVGTYIALEMVRMWHERYGHGRNTSSSGHGHSTSTSSHRHGQEANKLPPWRVVSCILLTPTIVDLHKSPTGVLATPLLTGLPGLSTLVPWVAHGLLHSLLLKMPASWLEWTVQRATGMPAGSHGLETTLAFLRSPRGVKQALIMAGGELKEIRADQWGDEVWGAVEAEEDMGATTTSPLLYLWFAKEDHWVASTTREEIVKKRGMEGVQSGQKKPVILIDETHGLIHAWCLEQNQIVAERVGDWLEEILGS